jgi:hypothetical protein
MSKVTTSDEKKIAEFSATEQALAELRQRHEKAAFDVTTTKGMEAAKVARAELRSLRTSLEAKREELKRPLLEQGRLLDAEARRITAELSALEDPIDSQIKAEEKRKEREKAEREEAERQRVQFIRQRFDDLKRLPMQATGKAVEEINRLIAIAENFDPTDFDEEYLDAAKFERQMVINALKSARDFRLAQDKEAAETAEKLKRLEELEKAEAERKAREAQEQAAKERAAAEEERQRREQEEVERQRREAAERQAREERERQEAEARQKRWAELAARERQVREEQARLKAEREAQERVQREHEKRLAEQKEEREIANATLREAAQDALDYLRQHAPRLKVTRKLAAALERDQKQAA